ncbi:hypothetical protein BC835DRAFT_1311073 [Cytidiella melzeri]|nr:hypothetical protein BC835DRAFT_1311073 [Cytidiella melzeri]
MAHVANRQQEWTIPLIYEALFHYCFPEDYKLKLRNRLMRSTQGARTVGNFARNIEQLANHFPDVTDRQLVQIFWEGLKLELRLHLIERGKNPEKTSLESLLKHASLKEKSLEAARLEAREFDGRVPGRTWGRCESRTTGPIPYKKPSQQHSRTAQQKPKTYSAKIDTAAHRTVPIRPKEHRSEITKAERDKRRAEGRCFTCSEQGHESRNCQERKKARAPKVAALSMSFKRLEKLANKACQAGARVASIRVDLKQDKPSVSHDSHEWRRAHRTDTHLYIKALFDSYCKVGEDERHCFEVSNIDEESFEVID